MMLPYIFNLQKFSVHDGPGIRTTVFFKGCPLRCRWCHNPEGLNPKPEDIAGPDNAAGPAGKPESAGKQYPAAELLRLLSQDQIFYDQSGGGVTLSGGEVMMQDMDYLLELLSGLKRLGISVAIDTSGFAPAGKFAAVLPYTDLFLYDLKLLDEEMHRRYTGVSNRLILDNLTWLSSQKARIWLRLIMIKGVNDGDEPIRAVINWLNTQAVSLSQINLLPYHDFGRDKYQRLGRECTQNFVRPNDERLARIQALFTENGYETLIGG